MTSSRFAFVDIFIGDPESFKDSSENAYGLHKLTDYMVNLPVGKSWDVPAVTCCPTQL